MNNRDEKVLEDIEVNKNSVKDDKKSEVLFTFARKSCGCGGNCNGSCK